RAGRSGQALVQNAAVMRPRPRRQDLIRFSGAPASFGTPASAFLLRRRTPPTADAVQSCATTWRRSYRMSTIPRPFTRPSRPPELHTGDRMTREEFHRIYEQMPKEFRAELIGGIV